MLRHVDEDRRAVGRISEEGANKSDAIGAEIELLGGAIVAMSPQDPRHAATVTRLAEALMRAVGADKLVRIQAPFSASDQSLPEPDVAVVPRRGDDGHPDAAFLVAEVANTSLQKDRSLKSDVYAQAAIPEYWIADLARRSIEVRKAQLNGRYTIRAAVHPGNTVRIDALDNAEIAVSDVLR
ncbi:MAG TPA: Uma2 family endonuclease [Polyangia bacterium]|nr:Uma2 family endonuclease [Polyangia bacterium]